MNGILTLNRLKELTDAYNTFVTIQDSDLPEYYKQSFPHTCKCGGEVIMTSDIDGSKYTQLQCCNPYCWVKMAHRFAYFTKSLGFKGFGVSTSVQLYQDLAQTFKYPTFLSIFLVTDTEINRICGDAYTQSFSAMREELHNKGFQFKDAIASLGIQDIGKGSTLFDVVKSPAVLLECILKDKLDDICDMAGINAPKTRFALSMAKIDIITLMVDVMPYILSTPNHEVYVAITGSVSVNGISYTRQEFIKLCEDIKDKRGEQAFKLVETKAVSKIEYVIADTPSASSKYELGKRLNKLITATDFYNILRSQVTGGAMNE